MLRNVADSSTPTLPDTHRRARQVQPAWHPDTTPAVDHGRAESRQTRTGSAVGEWLRANTFAPSWLPAPWRHPAVGYIVAALLQVLFVVVEPVLTGGHPSTLFMGSVGLLVVALVALSWGAGPSLFAILVGVTARTTYHTAAIVAGEPVMVENALQAALCVMAAIGISVAAGSTERSRRQAVDERTEAQARELAMREVQARMDEFLAVASHDLRSPLTATISYLDLGMLHYDRLASQLNASQPELATQVARVRARLDDASQSVERLTQLVEMLFDAAQARSSTLTLHRAPCDLAALVREQVAALRLTHPTRTLRLELLGERPVPITADALRMSQVVTNFITNALKYSPADQPVTVRLTLADGWARVGVVDRGPGLPPRERERIWQRFYRAQGVSVQSGSKAGLGLGLYICKAIVEGHGGHVGVESEPGKGSTFWYELPLAASPANDPRARPQEQPRVA